MMSSAAPMRVSWWNTRATMPSRLSPNQCVPNATSSSVRDCSRAPISPITMVATVRMNVMSWPE